MSGASDKRPLGRILLSQKVVSSAELDELLVRQREDPNLRLASTAMRSGRVDEVDLLRALSEQHGVPGIDLSQVVVPTANLRLVPRDVALECRILPFSVKSDAICLAMADPTDSRVLDEIEFVTGHRVIPYVALHDHLQRVIAEAYDLLERGEAQYVGPHTPAEYLESLGLRSAETSSIRSEPRLRSSDAVVPAMRTEIEPSGGPELDAAFDSKVALLPRDSAPGGPGPIARSRRILVVDDEDDIRRMLRRVLQERDYTVIEASTGPEALSMIRNEAPDLVVLDAMLPEIHGFDICRRMKASQKYNHVPIIMVSAIYRGWRFAEDLKSSYGVSAFLEKPFKISEVLAAIERSLMGVVEEADDEDELSSSAAEALAAGIHEYKTGNLDGAIQHLKRAVGFEARSFRLHYHLGLLYGRRDSVFDAIQELEVATELAPRNFAALKNLAVLYQKADFRHRAIEMWERALQTAPDDETRQGIKEHLMSLL